ncbi:hypothetical protein IE53DRAFT_390228 [Violaceomyces palustris]|uniref:Uncharacterized protein n=1 Tax=Violaceomyces palustris TaxID=1673888 RepID=A0ACD0NPC8_9BASI|nr:hypothetical protein IE53DRAFT_390228 [Violaceomyces palustris]
MIQQEAGHESGVEPVRDADELKATEAWILRIVNEMLGNLGLIPPSLADLELLKLEARKIKDSAETDKTIIVLRGPAGTGKTSLINNLVGYRLLATSWNGACTTVATELHYTDKDEHTAIIHYVSKVEWFEELRAYCDEETDELEDVSFPNDSIAMTINKLSTLYPGKGWQRGNPKRWTPKTIMDMERGQTRLGSTEAIDAVSAERFREALKKYNDPHFSRVWPFIKLIRIKTKSDILRYGAVLVDLPGTNDSNVARNSVAASYGKIYDQTWVTINIKRAKTDSDIDEFLRRLQDEQVESDRGNIRFVITHCDDGMQNFDTAQMIRDVPALAKNEEFQKSVDQLKQQYRQKRALERAKKALNHIRTRPSGTSTPTLQRNGGEEFSQVITQLDEVSESIEENKRKLGTIFSQARSQDVAESLESKFRRVTSLCTSRSRELGIHFVGNNDYRALTCDDVDEVVNMSSCFGLVQDTGVPELASLILKTSQRKLRARTAKRLEKLKNLCLDIELEKSPCWNTK